MTFDRMTDAEHETVSRAKVGDIVRLRNKRYQITKRGTSAVAIARWYWWDTMLDDLYSLFIG